MHTEMQCNTLDQIDIEGVSIACSSLRQCNPSRPAHSNPISLRLASIVSLKDSLQTNSGIQTNLHDILDSTGIVGESSISLCGIVERVSEKSLIALLRQINTAHKFRESAMVDDLLSTCFDNYQCMLPLLRTFVWVIGTSTPVNYISP